MHHAELATFVVLDRNTGQLPKVMSNVLAVSFSEQKYYETTNQDFKNKPAYRLLSSTSRRGERKGPFTGLCNSNKIQFLRRNKVSHCISLTCCLPQSKLVRDGCAPADKLQG